MKIEWSARARGDLLEIFDYILLENPRAAGEVLERIEGGVANLADHPGLGRPGRVEHTRELVIPGIPYILPYFVRSERIIILRVMHSARKWPSGIDGMG